ncbi:ATP-binding protein [Leptospira sp. WS92.C1]
MPVNNIKDVVSVFLVEDDEEDFILLKEYLKDIPYPEYTIFRFKDVQSALDELKNNSFQYDIFIIDHFLGSYTGMDLFAEIRSLLGDVPAILISGLSAEELKSIAFRSGFADCIEKRNLSARNLSKALLSVQRILEDPSQNKKRNLSEDSYQVETIRMDAIGSFSGGIAHDFNNLLNIIIANLDLLEMQCKEQPAVLSRIQSAQNAIMRGADVNKKLLNFSRKQFLNPIQSDPNSLISDFLTSSKDLFPENVKMEFDLSIGENIFPIDPIEFANTLSHLLQNAKEAIEENGGRVLLETFVITIDSKKKGGFSDLGKGDYFLLRVGDNGSGMNQEHQGKIYDPFFTTKSKGKNTGLGLSMIYGFVKRCGGRIFVESHSGVGSDFLLFFPVQNFKSNPDSDKKTLQVISKTIIYFCEEGPVSSLVSYYLESLGHSVLRVNDLQKLKSFPGLKNEDLICISEMWKKDFQEWKELLLDMKKSNSKLIIYDFSFLRDDWENENSLKIQWPISRKSLESHFGRN